MVKLKVRLLLDKNGEMTIEASTDHCQPTNTFTVTLADEPVG